MKKATKTPYFDGEKRIKNWINQFKDFEERVEEWREDSKYKDTIVIDSVINIINEVRKDFTKVGAAPIIFIDSETQLECCVMRQPNLALNGWVQIPETLAENDLDSLEDKLELHNSEVVQVALDGKIAYIIFSADKYGDLIPDNFFQVDKMFGTGMNLLHYASNQLGEYRNVDFMKQECVKLAKQLKELADKKNT